MVEFHCVLADLEDDWPPGPFGAGDDGFGVLEGDHVERHQSGACAVGGGDEVGGTGERHQMSLRMGGPGQLQQFAAPNELYNKPANAFVAGFIGSPAMNLLTAPITRRQDR